MGLCERQNDLRSPPNVSVSISRTDELSLSATKSRLPLGSSDNPLGCAQLVRLPEGPLELRSYPAQQRHHQTKSESGAGILVRGTSRCWCLGQRQVDAPKRAPFPLTTDVVPEPASYRQIWCCPAIATKTSPFAATATSQGEFRSCLEPAPPPR